MGISGLLPVLKSITNGKHVSCYAGQKVAIDAYSWLHKGAYSCSRELCERQYTTKFIVYCMQRITMLKQNDVIPVVVFDGGKLPMKAGEEDIRAKSREENLAKARAFEAAQNMSAANEHYQRAVDICPAVAKQFIEALKQENVEYIVAPYEADAQMTHLAISEYVHAVITEDSDMLPYGCPRVFFKMDRSGDGQEVCISQLPANRGLSFVGFTADMFLEMCIFAGCDFLKAPHGIGVKKAHQLMKKYRTFTRVCKALRFEGKTLPKGYERSFQRAKWTFRHQRVYSRASKAMTHLRPIPDHGLMAEGVKDALSEADRGFDFLGPLLDDALATQIAEGDVDPLSHQPLRPPVCMEKINTETTQLNKARQLNVGPAKTKPHQRGRFSSIQGHGQQGIMAFFAKPKQANKNATVAKSAPAKTCAHEPVGQNVNSQQDTVPDSQGSGRAGSCGLPMRFKPATAGTSSQQSSDHQNSPRAPPQEAWGQTQPSLGHQPRLAASNPARNSPSRKLSDHHSHHPPAAKQPPQPERVRQGKSKGTTGISSPDLRKQESRSVLQAKTAFSAFLGPTQARLALKNAAENTPSICEDQELGRPQSLREASPGDGDLISLSLSISLESEDVEKPVSVQLLPRNTISHLSDFAPSLALPRGSPSSQFCVPKESPVRGVTLSTSLLQESELLSPDFKGVLRSRRKVKGLAALPESPTIDDELIGRFEKENARDLSSEPGLDDPLWAESFSVLPSSPIAAAPHHTFYNALSPSPWKTQSDPLHGSPVRRPLTESNIARPPGNRLQLPTAKKQRKTSQFFDQLSTSLDSPPLEMSLLSHRPQLESKAAAGASPECSSPSPPANPWSHLRKRPSPCGLSTDIEEGSDIPLSRRKKKRRKKSLPCSPDFMGVGDGPAEGLPSRGHIARQGVQNPQDARRVGRPASHDAEAEALCQRFSGELSERAPDDDRALALSSPVDKEEECAGQDRQHQAPKLQPQVFHGLDHLGKFGAFASKVVDKAAARHGLEPAPVEKKKEIWKPFRAPRAINKGKKDDKKNEKPKSAFQRFKYRSQV